MTRFPSFYGWIFHHLSLSYVYIYIGVYTPGGAIGKECTCQCRRHTRKCGFDPWVGKIPWSRKWQLTLVFLPGKYHGQRSQGYRGLQSWATVGLQRVWHHWVSEHARARAYTHTHTHTHTQTYITSSLSLYMFFHRFFSIIGYYRILNIVGSLGYTVNPHCLSILYIVVCIC